MHMRITITIIIYSSSIGQTASGLINPDPGIIATVTWHHSSWLILLICCFWKQLYSFFLHHRCNVSYFRVGVFYISQPRARPFCHFGLFLSKWRLRRLVLICAKRSWTEADRPGHTGQREGFKAKGDLRLHGEQDWHIQTGENIALLSNKATYSGGDGGEGVGGGGGGLS